MKTARRRDAVAATTCQPRVFLKAAGVIASSGSAKTSRWVPRRSKAQVEVGLHGDADGAAGRDDAEQHARPVRALGAAGEEHVEAQLGDVLELALGGRVVDGDVGVVDEAEEGVAVALVVADRRPSAARTGAASARRQSHHRLSCSAIGRMRRRRCSTSASPTRPSFCAASSSTYIAERKAPPSAARAGCVSSASRNFLRPWALQPASMTRPEA